MPGLDYQAIRLNADNIELYIDALAAAERELFPEPWSRAEYLRDICENPLACYVALVMGRRLLAYGNFSRSAAASASIYNSMLSAFRRIA